MLSIGLGLYVVGVLNLGDGRGYIVNEIGRRKLDYGIGEKAVYGRGVVFVVLGKYVGRVAMWVIMVRNF